jgi:methylase of polypeptide subunit release factors
MCEPKIAIFGGPDGLDLYRQLFDQISKLQISAKFVLTESLPTQHQSLAKIASQSGYKLHTTDDFIQVFEVA